MKSIRAHIREIHNQVKSDFIYNLGLLFPGWEIIQTEWFIEDEMIFSVSMERGTDHLTVWLHENNAVTITAEDGAGEQREKRFRDAEWSAIPTWVTNRGVK